ncbi:putative nuclease HARBI1 [Hypomesus transpacificus]|uniref:putative nuclease HARBI1 n=1 Tax=Hypomesus transpacificus TaxID=137520 RepID=UPI001F087E99|nr:putative nuclease HARBI1 [Hypomesus transpacificus]
MASPFVEEPVELGARIVRGALRRARTFRDRQNPLAFHDDHLYERYRFSAEGMTYLCQLLEPYVANATHRSRALTVPQTVCVALRYFATGTFMYSVGDAENISKNTVCRTIRKVVLALTYSLGFPRVIGAIDCTHIPIAASLGENEGDFINRRSFHSINVQMTCDHQSLVTSIEAKWPGSVHDSRIFRESALCHRLEQGMAIVSNILALSGLLVGDRGYACQPFLMTPYPDPNTRPQTAFNVALSRTRVKIEMTFGILKARFNCLRGLRVAPDRACQVVTACAVLHNVASIRRERAPPVSQQPPDVVDPITLDYPTGRAVRDAITRQFFV